MNTRFFRWIGVVAIATLLLIPGEAAFAQRMVAPKVTPTEGVPGVRFVFTAPGFRGAGLKDDQKTSLGEEIAYWINLPDGKVIATQLQKGKGNESDKQVPMVTRANGYGEVTIRWDAPNAAMTGPYSMVMRGVDSKVEVVVPFTIHADGWQTVVQTNVYPPAGPPGTAFRFVATGFQDAIDKGDRRGEQVAYWFNTPDGSVISTEKRTGTNDHGNKTKPLLHFADQNGTVNLVWSAPETLKPGLYSVVFHGLNSHYEVKTFFTIQ